MPVAGAPFAHVQDPISVLLRTSLLPLETMESTAMKDRQVCQQAWNETPESTSNYTDRFKFKETKYVPRTNGRKII